MADIRLDVGIDVGASYKSMREDLNGIVSALNKQPKKVRVDLDLAYISRDVNALKSQLTDIQTQASGIKVGTNFSSTLGDINGRLNDIAQSLNNIGTSNGFNGLSNTIGTLKGELASLSAAMKSFQGINLNLGLNSGNAISRNTAYGMSARAGIQELTAQVDAMERLWSRALSISNQRQAAMAAISSSVGAKEFYNTTERLGAGNLTEQMTALRDYIALMQKAASMRGLDITPLTSQFSHTADEIIQSTQKVASGEQELEVGVEKLKSLFGSGINAEALGEQLISIQTSINGVTEAISKVGLGSEAITEIVQKIESLVAAVNSINTALQSITPVREVVDPAALQEVVEKTQAESAAAGQLGENVSQLKNIVESYVADVKTEREENEKAAEAHKKAAEAARKAAETRRTNAEAIRFAKQIIDDYYAALIKLEKVEGGHITRDENGNYITDDAAKYGQLTAELNRCTNAYNGLMAMHNEDVSTSKTSADIRDYEAQKSREAALAIEELTRKREKSNSKARDQQIAAEDRALQSYRTTLTSTEGAIQRWTAAERSKNQESRESYNRLKDSVEAMRQAKVQYDNGTGSLKNLNDKVAACKAQLKETEYTLKVNGDATKSWSDRLGSLAQKFSSWLSVSQVIMYAIRTIRKMITEVKEIDAAMTQFQIVTQASEGEMRRFGDTVAETAKRIGSSITDLVDSATTYARLGYSLRDSSTLAEYTSMLKAVGDIEVSDAQDAVTSITKAFGKSAEDIEDVMDKLVVVGNGFPISVSQISEGMTNASSALAAAGNTFEQSVALLTAANTTVNLCRAA